MKDFMSRQPREEHSAIDAWIFAVIVCIAILIGMWLSPIHKSKTENSSMEISDETFDLGARIGYLIHKHGGTREDLTNVIQSYKGNDAERMSSVLDKLIK